MGRGGSSPPHYLREWREHRNLTQDNLAERAKIGRAAISKIESGAKPLMQHRLQAFADALDIQISQIYELPPGYPQNQSANKVAGSVSRKLVGQTTRPALGLESGAPLLSEQRDLPIRGYAKGGEGGFFFHGEAMGFTYRPSNLIGVKDAYSFEVFDTSMEPAMMHGHLQWVHPHKAIHAGDNVVIELEDGETLVKRLVRRTAKEVILLQWNPKKEVVIPQARIKTMHLVIGGLYVRVG